ncbi:MAG: putative DNA binding domain-containing protein [Firmicutes bacterium]|nr:putative DNA binding domain-containing protein [Bacillota bacterium]
MRQEQLRKFLDKGEGFVIEFKECVDGLNNSVFETVCSFSNRYGGYVFLGVT